VGSANLSTESIQRHAEEASDRAVKEASPWIEGLGRFGHAAIALVYGTIGVLAAMAALGKGGGTTDTRGAMAWLVQMPFGGAILVAIAVGLAGYALWRFVQAIRDTESKGTDLWGLANRAVYAFIGVSYSALALSALNLARGVSGEESQDASAHDWTAWLLAQPFGQILVAIVGLVIISVGIVQFYMAYTQKCCDALDTSGMSDTQGMLVRLAGRIGFSARGVAFGIIGALFNAAAIHARAADAQGLGGALSTLAQQPFGPWLLGIVALGLICYAAFMAVQARYRRIVVR
jgi:hypothetical protein